MEETTTAKGEKLDCIASVVRFGSACAAHMGFETQFIDFVLQDGREVRWHSRNCARAYEALNRGDEVTLNGFLYGTALRRVTVRKDCRLWGMGEI